MKNMKIRDTKKRTENKRIREGDYAKPGVTVQGEWTTFTFDAEKEDSCFVVLKDCLLYTSPSPRDRTRSRMPSSA